MLSLILQYFGHLMQRTASLEKTPMLGKIEGKREKGMTEDELVGWHYQLNGHEFEQASLIVQLVKNLPAMREIPVSGRSAGEGIDYPLQYSWFPLWLSW